MSPDTRQSLKYAAPTSDTLTKHLQAALSGASQVEAIVLLAMIRDAATLAQRVHELYVAGMQNA